MNEIKISEKALEALASLISINQRYSHPYCCDAESIQKYYNSEIKPILNFYKNQSSTILREMEKREKIFQKQLSTNKK